MTAAIRSLLFTPAIRPDRFPKAAATDADALIIDLEDAVAEPDKGTARANVIDYLSQSPDIRQQIVVRINPLGRVCGLEDLAAIASAQNAPDCILLPKAESAEQIVAVARVLDDAGSDAKIAALIESALGVAEAVSIARAHSRLSFLMFGAADYAADLGQQVGRFRPEYARNSIVNAAAAGGVFAVDSPFFAIDDPDALSADCDHGRALGFQAKAAIHPSQLGPINASYSPTDEERTQARRIVDAAPDGVGVLDGKMVDIAMVRWARRILALEI